MKKTRSSTPTSKRTDESPLSVAEALKRARQDFVVKSATQAEVGEEGEHAGHFSRIRIASFKDLQRMSLVPEGLDEKTTIEAITRDSEAAFEAAQRAPQSARDDCGCHDDDETSAPGPKYGYAEALRSRYSTLRRQFNPNLARELSKVYQRDVRWDHAVVSHVFRWVDRLQVAKVIDFGSILVKDIVVQKNSTLTVSAGTQLLWGNNVRIHSGGKIVTNGSYLKILCASIEGNIA